jgi:hypothetical protein
MTALDYDAIQVATVVGSKASGQVKPTELLQSHAGGYGGRRRSNFSFKWQDESSQPSHMGHGKPTCNNRARARLT